MKTTMIAVVIVPFLVAVISAAAIEGCFLPERTDGSDEVLIPDHQSSIPSYVQTMRSSVTGDGAPLGDVDPDGEDDDPCGCNGYHQSTAAGICPNDYVAGFPPHHVDVQIDACPCPCPALGGITTEIRTEEGVEDDKFGNSLVGITFEDAVALMVSSFQPRDDLSSFLNTMARVAIVFDLTVSLIAWMLLRIGHPRAANYFRRTKIPTHLVLKSSSTFIVTCTNTDEGTNITTVVANFSINPRSLSLVMELEAIEVCNVEIHVEV